jgi:ATP-dependent helicase/nuclease subunit A
MPLPDFSSIAIHIFLLPTTQWKFDCQLCHKDMKSITVNHYLQILELHPTASPFHLSLMIGFHTGLRRGEVCGLQWSDISFENSSLTVSRTMIQDKNGIQLGTPKTQSSYRTITFDDLLLNALKTMRKHQMENKLRYGKLYYESNFVCTKDNGEPVTLNSIKYYSSKIQSILGFPFNFHSLQHTHATMLLEDGTKPKIVQERLGHSRISTTMDKYVHLTKKMRSEAVDIFTERMKRARQ